MKAIIVIDIPHIQEPCEIDELGLVADMHIRPTTLSLYKSFDLKEVDVRPMPEKKEVNLELDYEAYYQIGWNECLEEIEDVGTM